MYFLVGMVLINKVAEKIRYKVDNYTAAFPTILEIPSKEHPYGRLRHDVY
jgi:V-type H+-transporting ATPase subunit F